LSPRVTRTSPPQRRGGVKKPQLMKKIPAKKRPSPKSKSPTPPAAEVAANAVAAGDFVHDYLFIRSAALDGSSRASEANGFRWPLEAGGIVEAPDWDPDPKRACGGGLHGVANGIGDWCLLGPPTAASLWYICGAREDETVRSEGKVRVKRCKVLYVGAIAGAIKMIAPAMSSAILALVQTRVASATPEGERATGPRGAASSTGPRGAASSTGDGGAASSTGPRGAASSTGDGGVALAAGYRCRGRVADGGLLVLVERDVNWKIVGYFAALCGEKGVKADEWYTLVGGQLTPCDAEGNYVVLAS